MIRRIRITLAATSTRAVAAVAALFFSATTATLAQTRQGSTTEALIGSFLPKGFHVIGEAKADFNRDGLTDLVVVLDTDTDESDQRDDAVCPLTDRDLGRRRRAREDGAAPGSDRTAAADG
jgi:hypothetical protein